jgi:ElaB/YqjD/DUF883 family membrane-anchored ribosome-binding protein
MSEEQPTPQTEAPQQKPGEAWEEVGRQFQALGESLAAAVRTAWHSDTNRQRVQEMQTGLESMINEVGQAIKDTATSPEAQQARSEAEKALETVRAAGEQTIQEVRPHLVSTLRQLNAELQKLIGQMEQPAPVADAGEPKPPVVDVTPDE